MKCQTISLKYFFAAKLGIYYVAIATVIFSHVKITCYFHVWRYHVFARKLTRYLICVYTINASMQGCVVDNFLEPTLFVLLNSSSPCLYKLVTGILFVTKIRNHFVFYLFLFRLAKFELRRIICLWLLTQPSISRNHSWHNIYRARKNCSHANIQRNKWS